MILRFHWIGTRIKLLSANKIFLQINLIRVLFFLSANKFYPSPSLSLSLTPPSSCVSLLQLFFTNKFAIGSSPTYHIPCKSQIWMHSNFIFQTHKNLYLRNIKSTKFSQKVTHSFQISNLSNQIIQFQSN